MSVSRRNVLRAVGEVVPVGLSGCLGDGISGPTDTDTTRTVTLPRSLEQLSFTAQVVRQSSSESPPLVETTLTNSGADTITIGTGPTLVFRVQKQLSEQTILLYPDEGTGPNETPDQPTRDCWRYTDDHFFVQDIQDQPQLKSGESLTARHHVYTVGTETPCLPSGEYTFSDTVYDQENTHNLPLILTVDIDGKQTISVDGGVGDVARE